ncbi:hypothetical protein EDD18DRAFT_1109231 [Armillaria luteobubalina]|uniref:Uncharacterized protein n=1 Tax=Armillaria luteobubalina TaxID=153913 RepID=A0AA39PYN5_9AGAR|nr:hypothetical protein EDD18DRAFT_1109231 [Armillaria luteobubalina]
MQPVWHQNEAGILPLLVYNWLLQKNPWKGGQNGIVSILIGLMWWGQGTLKVEDRALWMEMVVDVNKCIQNIYAIYLPLSSRIGRQKCDTTLFNVEIFRKGQVRVRVDTIASNGATDTMMSKVFGN